MMVAGIGCRAGVTVAEVLAAVDAALQEHGLDLARLDALATIPARQDEAALKDAARHFGLPLAIPAAATLACARTLTSSPASIAATLLGSASEAAALAAAGPGAVLLGPRLIAGDVTCAIACKEDT